MKYENKGEILSLFEIIESLDNTYRNLSSHPGGAICVPACAVDDVKQVMANHSARLVKEVEKL